MRGGIVEVGDVLLGAVVVGLTVVVTPGVQGVATVADVPLGEDGVAAVALPVPAVDGVEDEVVVFAELVLFTGVQGAVVEVVPVVLVPVLPPVTLPALPAVVGVVCVAEGDPIELGVGGDVCNVPTDPEVFELPGDVEVVPGAVEVVPGEVEVTPVWVEVVPGRVDVVPGAVDVVCGPMPGLGVTEPLCAVARPTDNANTEEANRIFRIEPAPS